MTRPPRGHGPGSRRATQKPTVRQALHGPVEAGACICRWCAPYRYPRDFAGGGHQEWAEYFERAVEEIERRVLYGTSTMQPRGFFRGEPRCRCHEDWPGCMGPPCATKPPESEAS